MRIYAPDYYKDFKCIADQCKHSCCIGWEIDIDKDTYDKYKSVGGIFGEKLCANIDTKDTAHFCLTENERCPFLNNDNLCDIIINLGADHLCQICDDHPRYRNFFSDREEIGLGLCCEAAAELIIIREQKTEFIPLNNDSELCDDDEIDFFAEREKVYHILQNRDLSVNDRISCLTNEYKIHLPQLTFAGWASTLRELERLDLNWDTYIEKLSLLTEVDFENYTSTEWEIAREQLLIYFVHRHMADGFYNGKIYERLAFAILCDKLIIALCAASGIKNLNGLTEIARAYSSEIEYSEENLEKIFDVLSIS